MTSTGLTTEASDMAIAEECLGQLEHEFAYVKTHGWMQYDGRLWIPDSDLALRIRVGHMIRELRQKFAAAGSYEAAKRCVPNWAFVQAVSNWLTAALVVPAGIEAYDANPEELNVANGVLNLRTGTLEPHHFTQQFTYCLPVRYRKSAPQGAWLSFLQDVVEPDSLGLLQEAVGYTLTGLTREERLFYICGPTRSGKGVFSETLLALFTTAIAAEVEFNTFTRDRDNDANNFDLAPLRPARLIFASESNKAMRLNDAKVKALTGGNKVRCAFKYSTHFEYRPQFKIWLVSNYDVHADPNDDAVWGRIIRFSFPNSFKGHEDKELKARLSTPEALEGVLAWAVEGAIRWYQHGLAIPATVDADTQAVRDELDTVQAWLDECTQRQEGHFESNGILHQSYEIWCKKHGVMPYSVINLNRILVSKGYYQARRPKQRGFIDIALVWEHSHE